MQHITKVSLVGLSSAICIKWREKEMEHILYKLKWLNKMASFKVFIFYRLPLTGQFLGNGRRYVQHSSLKELITFQNFVISPTWYQCKWYLLCSHLQYPREIGSRYTGIPKSEDVHVPSIKQYCICLYVHPPLYTLNHPQFTYTTYYNVNVMQIGVVLD